MQREIQRPRCSLADRFFLFMLIRSCFGYLHDRARYSRADGLVEICSLVERFDLRGPRAPRIKVASDVFNIPHKRSRPTTSLMPPLTQGVVSDLSSLKVLRWSPTWCSGPSGFETSCQIMMWVQDPAASTRALRMLSWYSQFSVPNDWEPVAEWLF